MTLKKLSTKAINDEEETDTEEEEEEPKVVTKAAPKKAAPKKTAPKKTAPKKTAPKKTTPKKTTPKKSVPKSAASKGRKNDKSGFYKPEVMHTIGTMREVFNDHAVRTPGGLMKKDLISTHPKGKPDLVRIKSKKAVERGKKIFKRNTTEFTVDSLKKALKGETSQTYIDYYNKLLKSEEERLQHNSDARCFKEKWGLYQDIDNLKDSKGKKYDNHKKLIQRNYFGSSGSKLRSLKPSKSQEMFEKSCVKKTGKPCVYKQKGSVGDRYTCVDEISKSPKHRKKDLTKPPVDMFGIYKK